jgi:hypothetical protein
MERTGETVKILAALLVRTTRIVLDEKKSCYYEGQWIPRNMITYEVRKYDSTSGSIIHVYVYNALLPEHTSR